jgi:hypothetical protein
MGDGDFSDVGDIDIEIDLGDWGWDEWGWDDEPETRPDNFEWDSNELADLSDDEWADDLERREALERREK